MDGDEDIKNISGLSNEDSNKLSKVGAFRIIRKNLEKAYGRKLKISEIIKIVRKDMGWSEREIKKEILYLPKEFSERKLKGSMGECIIERLFEDAGYNVFKFGYEFIPYLKYTKLKDNSARRIIQSMPDFVIRNDAGYPFFVEVKYKKKGLFKKDADKFEALASRWRDILIVIIKNDAPRITFYKNGQLYPLEENDTFNISKSIIDAYSYLAELYFDV